MLEIKQYTIDEALDFIEAKSLQIGIKPVLVAVYGSSNGGKTFFQSKAGEKLPNTGITASHDAEQAYRYAGHFDYLFIHAVASPQEVCEQTRRHLGRDTDINVFIYNPNLVSPDLEAIAREYDIAIPNPDSRVKNPS